MEKPVPADACGNTQCASATALSQGDTGNAETPPVQRHVERQAPTQHVPRHPKRHYKALEKKNIGKAVDDANERQVEDKAMASQPWQGGATGGIFF